MLPCGCSWCTDCSPWGRVLIPGGAKDRPAKCLECGRPNKDEVDGGGWVLTGSNSSLVRAAHHSMRRYSEGADRQPFRNIEHNDYSRQYVKSRRQSSSDSDCSTTSVSNGPRRSSNGRSHGSSRNSSSRTNDSRRYYDDRDDVSSRYSSHSRNDVNSNSNTVNRHRHSRDDVNSHGNAVSRHRHSRDDVRRSYDNSEVGSGSSRSHQRAYDGVDGGQFVREETSHQRALPGPVPRTVMVTQQPRSVDMFRPDMEDQYDETSINSSRSSNDYTRRPKTKVTSTPSVDSSESNSTKKVQFRKISQHSYMTPSEAALVAVDSSGALPNGGAGGSADGGTGPSPKKETKTTSWIPSLFFQREDPKEEEKTGSTEGGPVATGVVEKSVLGRLMSRMVEGSDAANAKFEFSSKESGIKVHLRSKDTANNIANRKSIQAQQIMQYIFGYITVVYKCSKEKKLQVDVISVKKMPRYTSAIFSAAANDDEDDEKTPSLNYVNVEVCLRSPKGKEYNHLIKKFRTGDVHTDDDSFEPEFSHTTKELMNSVLVLSVTRQGHPSSCPTTALGHAIRTLSRPYVQDTKKTTVTFPLKQGVVRQDVKGSILIVLSCSHTNLKAVELAVEVRMVQHLDLSVLGITHSTPAFKVKPEIKVRLQFLGSKKSSSKPRDSAWIELQNLTRSRNMDEEGKKKPKGTAAGDKSFGGWGTMFPESCYFTRTALEAELKKFDVCFLVEVVGRSNLDSLTRKKEVVLGKVILGPELLYADIEGIGTEVSPPLTHWGHAINKRTSVEMLHRLHL